MDGDRRECLSAGMDDYFRIPMHIEEVRVVLEQCGLMVEERAEKFSGLIASEYVELNRQPYPSIASLIFIPFVGTVLQ